MCVEENYLKDVWRSLFKIDVFSEIKDVDNNILGPFMLIERTVFAFRELGLNYVRSLEDAKNVKAELLVVKEKLNETQKPCEKCLSLSNELVLAKKRAKDAEHRVTQIAEILVVRSSDECEKPKLPVASPTVSPKRKKSRIGVKDDDGIFSSQAVEIGSRQTQVSPLSSKKCNSFSSPSKETSKLTPYGVKGKVKRLSRSTDLGNEVVTRVSPRRNLSADFSFDSPISSPRKSKRSVLGSINRNDVSVCKVRRCDPVEDSLTTVNDKKCGWDLERVCVHSEDGTVVTNKTTHENLHFGPVSHQFLSEIKSPDKDPVKEKSKKIKNKISIDEKPVKKLDKYIDIVFEKKVAKKKLKQLTLEMKSNKMRRAEDAEVSSHMSDSELILPSPEQRLTERVESQEMNNFLNDLKISGVTSTQKPQEDPTIVLEKRKSSSPTKQKAVATTSNKGLDNSYDVILDRRKKCESPNYKYKGKTVRGKARAKLQGWDCEDCKRYYELACKNQSPSKVKATMNLCSRHRSKHKQTRPPTPPGFWDIDIPDTPE